MSLKRDLQELITRAQQRGWEVSHAGKHLRFQHPAGLLAFGAKTPGERRSVENLRHTLIRLEREAKLPPAPIAAPTSGEAPGEKIIAQGGLTLAVQLYREQLEQARRCVIEQERRRSKRILEAARARWCWMLALATEDHRRCLQQGQVMLRGRQRAAAQRAAAAAPCRPVETTTSRRATIDDVRREIDALARQLGCVAPIRIRR